MLKLSRKANEAITIGPDITVHVLEVSGKYVRIGIDAPAELRISRTDSEGTCPGCGQPWTTHPEAT